MLSALTTNRGTTFQNNLSQIKSMMNFVKSSGNPQAMLENLMQNNPNYQKVMQLVRDNGNDPQKAFYAYAQQLGVDPNEIINMLK